MRVRARIFATLAGARAARAAFDANAVFTVEHHEGAGTWDYEIRNPGRAATRIRANGVRTRRLLRILRLNASNFALPEPDGQVLAGAAELPRTWDAATETD